MVLTQEDRQLIQYGTRVDTLLRKLNKPQILAVAKQWFNDPELRPSSGTWDDYAALETATKPKLVQQIFTDYPSGLYALQIAQLDLTHVMHQPVYKSWKVWELKQGNNQHRAELGIDASVLRDRLQQYLNPFFSCHVLVWKQNDTDTHWVRVCMTDSMEAHTAPRSSCLAYLVHLCNTPYILFSSIASSDRKEYVIQGVLHTFAAESAQEQNLSSKRVDTLSEIVLNQTSLGVFSKFRLDQVDSNPLDYRAKPSKPLKGAEAYVSTREEKKRIVPTDKDLVKNRYTQVAESFGWNPMPNLESLQIELTVPLENESLTAMLSQTEEGHTSVAEEEDEMQMTINIKGTNVLEGMRRLILEGVLQPPIPEWMMQLASAGTDNVVVTRDGRWAQAGAEPPSPMDTENIPPIS